jgi:chorismate synthase
MSWFFVCSTTTESRSLVCFELWAVRANNTHEAFVWNLLASIELTQESGAGLKGWLRRRVDIAMGMEWKETTTVIKSQKSINFTKEPRPWKHRPYHLPLLSPEQLQKNVGGGRGSWNLWA